MSHADMRVETMPVQRGHHGPVCLAGTSPVVRRLRKELAELAGAPCVLIEGEAGLGAREIAGELHRASRFQGSFLAIACSAATPAEIERTLFGDSRGGGGELETVDPSSAIAMTHGGTLFLEDVEDLSGPAQARLARIVRDGEVLLGGRGNVQAAVRLNGSLIVTAPLMDDGTADRYLRRDLVRYFSRSRILLPPLRHRREDIPAIVEALIEPMWRDAGRMGRVSLTPQALTLLAALPWRSNLHELGEVLLRIVNGLAGSTIDLGEVLAHVRIDGAPSMPTPIGTLRSAREQFERDYIANVLQHHRGRMNDAARTLGIQRTNLYRKARQLGLAVGRSGKRS